MTEMAIPMSAGEMAEILDELGVMSGSVADAMRRIPRSQWTQRAANGDFSLVEHVCHLRDIEAEGYVVRLRRMLREVEPVLADIDGGRLAIERNYQAQDAGAAFQALAEARAESIAILEAASDEDLQRTARFAGADLITMSCLAEMILSHDRAHRREIEELVAEFT